MVGGEDEVIVEEEVVVGDGVIFEDGWEDYTDSDLGTPEGSDEEFISVVSGIRERKKKKAQDEQQFMDALISTGVWKEVLDTPLSNPEFYKRPKKTRATRIKQPKVHVKQPKMRVKHVPAWRRKTIGPNIPTQSEISDAEGSRQENEETRNNYEEGQTSAAPTANETAGNGNGSEWASGWGDGCAWGDGNVWNDGSGWGDGSAWANEVDRQNEYEIDDDTPVGNDADGNASGNAFSDLRGWAEENAWARNSDLNDFNPFDGLPHFTGQNANANANGNAGNAENDGLADLPQFLGEIPNPNLRAPRTEDDNPEIVGENIDANSAASQRFRRTLRAEQRKLKKQKKVVAANQASEAAKAAKAAKAANLKKPAGKRKTSAPTSTSKTTKQKVT